MNQTLYTQKEIVSITELKPHLVKYYTERGVVNPSEEGKGRGHVNRYSETKVRTFAIIKRMVQFGVAFQHVSAFVEILDTHLKEYWEKIIRDWKQIDSAGGKIYLRLTFNEGQEPVAHIGVSKAEAAETLPGISKADGALVLNLNIIFREIEPKLK